MSRRIIVIERCPSCPHFVYGKSGNRVGYACVFEGIEPYITSGIPDNCPLTPMPRPYVLANPDYEIQPETDREAKAYEYGKGCGWNACINEMGGLDNG